MVNKKLHIYRKGGKIIKMSMLEIKNIDEYLEHIEKKLQFYRRVYFIGLVVIGVLVGIGLFQLFI